MIVSDEQQRDSDQHAYVSVLPPVPFPSRPFNYFMRCVLTGGSPKAELEADVGAAGSLGGTPGRWPGGVRGQVREGHVQELIRVLGLSPARHSEHSPSKEEGQEIGSFL